MSGLAANGTAQQADKKTSSRLSLSICRTMRDCVAPSAVRIASSRARTALRASIRFATLVHAIRSTIAAEAKRTIRANRAFPAISTLSGTTRIPSPIFQSPGSLPAMVLMSTSAVSGVIPGRSRPATFQRI